MPANSPVLDTNILIRFLISDNKEQTFKIRKLFLKSPKKNLEIPDLVIAEVIYVLLSFYKIPKAEIVDKIASLIDSQIFVINEKIIKTALDIFKKENISFVDAYLCSLVVNGENSLLYTFDLKLLSNKEIKSQTP